MLRRRRLVGRSRVRITHAIPQCVLPPVDHTIVAADRALPDDVSGRPPRSAKMSPTQGRRAKLRRQDMLV